MKRFNRVVTLLILSTLFLSHAWADRVSVEEAAAIAARFTNSQPQLSKQHKAPRKASNMRLAHKALQNNSEEAAFYVFNQENANGFVIVSADDRTAEEVLGYSEHGSFDADKINPNLRWWLSRYAEEITVLQTIDDSEFIEEPAARKAKQVAAIAPILVNSKGENITWYQEEPYYNLCPTDERDNTRCLTGCVATAASQIMYKWAWPTKGTGTASYTWYDCMDDDCNSYKTKTLTVQPGNTTYDWDNMLPSYEGKSATSAQKTAVATLMYHAGVAAKMGYGGDATGGSGAWTDDMGYGLATYFGYKFDKFITMYESKSDYKSAKGADVANVTAEYNVSAAQFQNYFNEDLEAGRPIIMGGEDTNGGGHEFVCCGRDANNKFYINWGWEGSGDGHYALTSLKPSGTSYNFSTHLDAIIGLRPDKKDLPKVTVTWSVDGNISTSEFTQEDNLVLPANPANCASGKVFVGWTAESSVDGNKPADLFTTAKGKSVTEAVTYYAVFAEAQEGEGGGGGEAAFDGETAGTYKIYANVNGTKYYAKGTAKKLESTTDETEATEYTFEAVDGGFAIKADGKYLKYGTSGTDLSTATEAYTWTISTGVLGTWRINATTGSNRAIIFRANETNKFGAFATSNVKADGTEYYDLEIGGEGGASGTTYSNYSLNCGAACVGDLTGITLNTTNVKKEFTEGATFNYDGLVVTAHYNGCDDKTVKPTSVSEPDMNQLGEQTVTVTYEGKSAEYKINVTALSTYAIRFFNNGVQVGETQNVKEGQAATTPATDPEACEGYKFAGWFTAALAEDNTVKPSYVTDFTATQDQDYFAVFSKTEAGEGGGSSETVDDKMTREITGSTETSYADWSGITISSAAVYAGNSAGGNEAIQLRSKNNAGIITTTSGGAIKKVTVIWNSNTSGRTLDIYGSNTAYSSPADLYGSSAGTLLGSIASDSQTELEIEGSYAYVGVRSNNSALYMDAITFTWEAAGGASSKTYYTTAPNCGAPVECELSSIELNIEKAQTSFVQGATFSYEGLVVTALYSNCASKNVKPTSVSEPDMNQLGEQTVTVTYEDKSAEYKINVTALSTYAIRFFNNGVQVGETQNVKEGQPATKPATDPEACEGYTFAGWFTADLAEDNTVKPSYVTDFTATQDQDYLAVFSKTEAGEGGGEAAFDGETAGSYKIYAIVNETKYYAKGTDKKLESTTDETEATEYTFEAVDGGFAIKADGKYLKYGTDLSTATEAYTWTIETGVLGTWRINATTGTNRAIIFRANEIFKFGAFATSNVKADGNEYYDLEIGGKGGASSKTYYTTAPNCGAPVECELTGIELNIEKAQTSFVQGAAFNYEGLVVTALYSNCASKNVTSKASVLAPDMSTVGEKTVTVSYEDKSAEYKINIKEPAKYTIVFYNNGAPIGTEQVVEEGQKPEVPANPKPACSEYSFVGWYTEQLAADNKEAKEWITDFTATQDQEYYAIFKKTVKGEGGSEAAFDGETAGTYKIYAIVNETKYFAKGTDKKLESTTDVAEATDYTFEAVDGGFAIKADGKYLKYGTNGTDFSVATEAYTWTIETGVLGTWRINATTGSNRAIIFRAKETNKFGVYATTNVKADGDEYYDLEIGGGGASSTTYYSAFENCGATDVENVQTIQPTAIKAIVNGQIVIIRGETMYSITGARIR